MWLQSIKQRNHRADTIRGYQGSAHEGELTRSKHQQFLDALPAKAAPTEDEDRLNRFVPDLTSRIGAKLQGFADKCEFVGGLGAVADQIGKAVVPVMAQAMIYSFRPSR
ncbi:MULTISPECIES: hypothetical protein [Agrobacterium]|uniref:Uncharacterized protein n=1 Tax=Agrobacterium rosae TaxID=1972867 RepID=A0A1R3U178_9HYPH|nr:MULTISPECIES: hypothetical protein [Agrobacterium]KAA3509523.1 hypothetical protein DXM21_20810 [Agrobacterium rosae]KAA3516423.1 hypothetical protein DXM25_19015 [Agrobacterium rosae]MCM2434933.1 DNA cytosine methyltransferase [Agrobacterium rosae]MDX8304609.1 hypothetical protein [Agrobacterium rosae]MDX8315135.1 hypothetical protein [Agrobacterium rosae]